MLRFLCVEICYCKRVPCFKSTLRLLLRRWVCRQICYLKTPLPKTPHSIYRKEDKRRKEQNTKRRGGPVSRDPHSKFAKTSVETRTPKNAEKTLLAAAARQFSSTIGRLEPKTGHTHVPKCHKLSSPENDLSSAAPSRFLPSKAQFGSKIQNFPK